MGVRLIGGPLNRGFTVIILIISEVAITHVMLFRRFLHCKAEISVLALGLNCSQMAPGGGGGGGAESDFGLRG